MGLFNNIFKKKRSDFVPSADLMTEDRFWGLIKTSFERAKGDYENQQAELPKLLMELNLQDIILFDNRFRQLRGEALDWNLWGAIYIIKGGCGDDEFSDFRSWVIANGKDFYYRLTKNPSSLQDDVVVEVDYEGISYIASDVFKELTGKIIPSDFQENIDVKGEEWSEEGDDLKNRFPMLWEKYAEGEL
ncbi:MAG: DUF4240 domain-containing protein [Flavobacteriales bacterium]